MSRAKTAAKLLFLLGLPLVVVGGLFGGGVVCGVEHGEQVRGFEAALFGEPAPATPPAGDAGEETADTPREPAEATGSVPVAKNSPPPVPAPASEAVRPPEPEVLVVPVPWVVPMPVTAVTGDAAEKSSPPPVAVAEPVPADLRRSFADRRVVTVKLLVGRTMIEGHPGWVDEVQALVAAASANYEVLFGIELRLHGMVEWEADRSLDDPDALLADVRARPREGADLLLAITDRPMVEGVGGRGDLPAAAGEVNGAYAVIFAGAHDDPYLRTVLHEVGHLFGAVDVTDSGSEAYRRASWMSYAPAVAGAPPWIDEANRRTILERKSLPFVAAAAPREGEHVEGI